MKEEIRKQLNEMGEKISRGVSVYKVKVLTPDYVNLKFDERTERVVSTTSEMNNVGLAPILKADWRAIKDIKEDNGTVFVSLDNALTYGCFVVGEATDEQKLIIRGMGEKISRTCTVYKVEAVRLNYETFQPETVTANVARFSDKLSKEDLAKELGIDARGIRNVKALTGIVYLSLANAIKRGLFVRKPSAEELLESKEE